MPFTFVEIEEHRTRNLVWLFACLVCIYALSIAVLGYIGLPLLDIGFRLSPLGFTLLFACALAAAGVHWLTSIHHLVDRVMATLRARPLDPGDTYHQRLRNVVEEARVATGGRYQITPYVIPSSALNACAVSDFDRNAAIAVTEGLLARLSREQLEGVVGHEAAHIARGDSLTKSVFCGLFGLHEEVLKQFSGFFDSGSRVRGRAGVFILFVWLVLWLTKGAKRLCELGISRQLEYRADAVAVSLTRNPVGLAEALQFMEERWRGVGAYGESLSTIFILDPASDAAGDGDEFSTLFATHPPTERRVTVLLDMVRIGLEPFRAELRHRPAKARVQAPETGPVPPGAPAGHWMAYLDGMWTAAMPLAALAARPDLEPETWVRRDDGGEVMPAYRQDQLFTAIQHRLNPGGVNAGAAGHCPKCHVGLTREIYEGAPLDTCPHCRGRYVTGDQLVRVLLRDDYQFSDAVSRMAAALPPEENRRAIERAFKQERRTQWRCPKCDATMHRKFYSGAYFIDVEQCVFCGLTWLDRDELELMQYLYERREGGKK